MKLMVLAPVVLVAHALTGCSQMVDVDEGPSAEAASAMIWENSLLTNSIDLNGLFANSIDLNGLDPQLLSTSVLSALQDSGQLGENTRLLYRYLASCALNPLQSLSFSWTDSSSVVHQETYWGAIGLAPTWQYAAITLSARRSVSACLAARANYYGVSVIISIRGPQSSVKNIDTEEQSAYPMEEGAFWGDLFAGTPQLYSCYNDANNTNSRAKYRECAAGHVNGDATVSECAYITILGSCDTLCDSPTSNDPYRPRCDDGSGPTITDLITVYLPQ